jgi:hypothetical protein
MLLKEIIAVYNDNYMKQINTMWQNAKLLIIKAGGTLCTTKTKHLKFSKSQTGSDVSVLLAS